jgi:hypothetical protein
MLCQLVCVDRRYQRMNCFNIRELQGVLKRKFFTDLVNSNDHRTLFDKTMIGLRFKTNNNLAINHDMSNFYNFGITTSPKNRNLGFQSLYHSNATTNNSTNVITNSTHVNFFTTGVVFQELTQVISSLNVTSLLTMLSVPYSFKSFISANLQLNLSLFSLTPSLVNTKNSSTETEVRFSSESLNTVSSLNSDNLMTESSNSFRFTRFNNPLISYDYKCGHYLGI